MIRTIADRRQTILIVEDDEDLLRLFRTAALTVVGYVALPTLNGFDVLQEIGGHAGTRNIPAG